MKRTIHFESDYGNCETCIKIGYNKAIEEFEKMIDEIFATKEYEITRI